MPDHFPPEETLEIAGSACPEPFPLPPTGYVPETLLSELRRVEAKLRQRDILLGQVEQLAARSLAQCPAVPPPTRWTLEQIRDLAGKERLS